MAQQNQPPGGPAGPAAGHTHHHPAPPQTPGVATQTTPEDTEVPPEDLKLSQVTDYLPGQLPDNLVTDNNTIRGAPTEQPKPLDVRPKEAVVDEALAEFKNAVLKEADKVPQAIRKIIALAFLHHGADRAAVRQDNPFNTIQVRPGGYAVLSTAVSGSEDAKSMKVDIAQLGKDLATLERIQALRSVIGPANEILDANESIAMNKIATHVEGALERGWSVIEHNGDLLRRLRAAVAIRGKPAAAAQQSRNQNTRRDAHVRQDEQSKMQTEGGAPASQGQTVTVSTQTPADAGTATAPKVHKKPGK